MKALRFIAGLALAPACVALTQTACSLAVFRASTAPGILGPFLALAAGFVLWICVYFVLPTPTRAYVLAHELTHALWAILTQKRVLRIRIRKTSGFVTLSGDNFLIALAPYFFPFYTALVIAAYLVASIFVDVSKYSLHLLAAVGFTWGFHATFTIAALMRRQSDIRARGALFSCAVIYLFNVLGICLWLVAATNATLQDMTDFYARHSGALGSWLWTAVRRLVAMITGQ